MAHNRRIFGLPCINSGFTLLELLIALFILALTAFGFSFLFHSTTAAIAKGKDEIIALNLARDLREEIRSVSFRDPEPNVIFGVEEDERNQPRIAFDDVDDYDGLTEFPPKNPYGDPIQDFKQFRRKVTVHTVGFTSDYSLVPAGPGGSAKLVAIEVYKIDDPAKLTGFPPLVRLEFLITAAVQ